MTAIIGVKGREILDSRGNPTIEVDVLLECGGFGRASVPSGASLGCKEAVELRDTADSRYGGKGVKAAVVAIDGEIRDAVTGLNAVEQRTIDKTLVELDGTASKSRLGSNSILAVSLAVAKAAAAAQNIEFFRYLGGVNSYLMPVPLMNILNGGAHADNKLDIQEFMIAPIKAGNFADSLRMGCEVFYMLKEQLRKAGFSTNVGDEGGFAPDLGSAKQALDLITEAITKAGYTPGVDITVAIDAAASEFCHDGIYRFEGQNLDAQQMVKIYAEMLAQYPIFSIEDGLAENDLEGWQLMTNELSNDIQLVGDDLFVTNPEVFTQIAGLGVANAILIKPNQIGTLTETFDTIELAKRFGYNTVISHRSGETEDVTIAHLAVATNAGQIKTGSLSRTDRICKYNELLRIEEQLSVSAIYAGLHF